MTDSNLLSRTDRMVIRRARLLVATLILALALPVNATPDPIPPLVDPEWLQERLGHPNLRVLDIRNPFGGANRQSFEAGHIPGAVYSNYLTGDWHDHTSRTPATLPPVPKLEELLGSLGIDNDAQVVIVHSGTDSSDFSSAARVFWILRLLGHEKVAILDGGFRAWKEAGMADESGWNEPHPSTFVARFQNELLATTSDVEAALRNGAQLVDGRAKDFYEGRRKANVALRAGTLPAAAHLDHNRLIDPGTGRFITPEILAARIAEAGLVAGRDTVTFCNIGHWSAATWFALHVAAGFPRVSLYDGSMAEWTLDPARPVVTRVTPPAGQDSTPERTP